MAKSLPGGPEPVEVYESVTARAAALPTPRVGQCAITLDDGAFSIYYGKYLGWRPPWTTPWGTVACTELAALSATFPLFPSVIPVLPINNFVPVVGRKYAVRASLWVGGGSTTTQVNIKAFVSIAAPPVRSDGLTFSDSRELGESLLTTVNAGIGDDPFSFEVSWVPTEGRATNVYLAGSVLSGAVAALDAQEGLPSSLKIVDVGPATAPLITT